jgi:phage terminase large subunit
MSLSLGQQNIVQSNKRFRVAVCGRRFGKTYVSIREIARFARQPNKKVFYIAPSYRMAKQIVWDKLKYKLLDLNWVKRTNESDLSIELVNGSKIYLRGADNYDSLRGVGLDFVVFDEFAMIDEKAWTEVIRPTLSDTGGSALFISTPMGQGNWAYDLYQKQWEDPDNWQSFQYTSLDGGRIPEEEILQAQRDLDERTFRQEYLASFETYAGRIYYAFDRANNVIDAEPTEYDTRTILVGADFNCSPMSAVIAVQKGEDICVIDEIKLYSSNTYELADEIRERYPNSRIVVYPDPAGSARSTKSQGQSDHTILQNAGFAVKSPRHHTPVRDRINAVNSRLCDSQGVRRLFVLKQCKTVIECLERQVYKEDSVQPDKDSGYDHMNDALGYLIDYLYPIKRHREVDPYAPKRWGHHIS